MEFPNHEDIQLCGHRGCTKRQSRACVRGFCLSCCIAANSLSFLKCPAPRHPKDAIKPIGAENTPSTPVPAVSMASTPVTPTAARSYSKMLSPTYAQKLLENRFTISDEPGALREKYRKEVAQTVLVKWWTKVRLISELLEICLIMFL